MSNKVKKKHYENFLAIKLAEYCEVRNPPECRRKDFRLGFTIWEIAEIHDKLPNDILNEIRLKRLNVTIVDGKKVRINFDDYMNWLLNSDINNDD